MTAGEFLSRFGRIRQNGPGDYHVPCAGHDDDARDPAKFSLHVTIAHDRILVHCFAGCPRERVLAALRLTDADLFLHKSEPAPSTATGREPVPTLSAFAALKKIARARLEEEGWRDGPGGITIPYRRRDGSTWRLRYRTSLKPGAGFRWDAQKDRPLIAYGLHHLDQWVERGELGLVEGESDAITAWVHGLPCLGLPGNLAVKALALEDLVGIDTLWIIREPGESGDGFTLKLRERLQQLEWTGTAKVIRL
jgi:hypothetical protein